MARISGMLPWVAQVATDRRLALGKRQVHVAAMADVDQSTIDRFERCMAWPRKLDQVIAAYAEILGVTQQDLWAEAVERWRDADATDSGGVGDGGRRSSGKARGARQRAA